MNPSISTYPHISTAIKAVQQYLRQAGVHIQTESWQAMKNAPQMFEALNISFSAPIPRSKGDLIIETSPNMPWAEAHFLERVGAHPLNPGEQYKNWPYYPKEERQDKLTRPFGGQFSHTYMERFWPREIDDGSGIRKGIRFDYGDFSTLIDVLHREPDTRQAFLPIWFPEDLTAVVEGQRVPCTLGYHFIRRGYCLNITYYIRSCDFFRHFRDDIYLACRLVFHILNILKSRDRDSAWEEIIPGTFSMHITSLHIWSKEYNLLKD